MGVFTCDKCKFTKETRCKPKKCPECGANESFTKKEEGKSK